MGKSGFTVHTGEDHVPDRHFLADDRAGGAGLCGLSADRHAVESGSATVSQFRENRDEPAESLYVRNNLANQFELPVLFYAVCLALFVTGGAGVAAVSLAWVFVLSRCGHAYVHVTSNRIRHRQPLFVLGFFALGAMWLLLALRLAI